MRALAVAAAVTAIVVAVLPTPAGSVEQARFTTTLLASRTLDIGPRGSSIGDTRIRRWRLTDSDGTAVGIEHDVCRFTSNELMLCGVVYVLPLGTITAAGVVGHGWPLAVTGGTEEYFAQLGQVQKHGRILTFTLE